MRTSIPGFLKRTALAGLAALAACESGVDPAADVSVLEPAAAAELSGVAGAALAASPAVRALDGSGQPVRGVRVTFEVATGGGTVSDPEVRTDAEGVARTAWTLGPAAGEQLLRATVGSTAVLIRAVVQAGPPAVLRVLEGDAQSGLAGERLAIEPAVRVEDEHGNAVVGAAVRFAAVDGAVERGMAVSDASGRAAPGGWTLGPAAGAQRLTATAGSAEAALTAVALAAAPAAIRLHAGGGQSAVAGTAVAVAPAVEVTDRFGNAVVGVAVRFAVEGGGGAIAGSSTTGGSLVEVTELTDGLGVARVPVWTLGTTAGPNVLVATSAGLEAVRITATATAASPTVLEAASSVDQSAPIGGAVAEPPAVRVRDAYGNPVPGVTITFAVTGGGGAVAAATVHTDAQGRADAGGWTLGGAPGTNTVRASAGGLAPVTFTATATNATPSSVAVLAGDAQVAPVGSVLPIAPSVVVRDGAGHGVPGVTVTFAVVSGGGSVTGASATTDASGAAQVGAWQLGTTAGANLLSVRAGSLPAIAVTAMATAGPVATLLKQQGDNQSAPAGTQVPVRPAVLARDAHGNAVAGVTITFAVSNGGGSVSGATAVTNVSGVAMVGAWTLGATPGENTLGAAAQGVAPLTFTATGTAGGGGGGDGGYSIDVRYTTNVTERQRQAFDGAAGRWTSLVLGDLPDVNLTIPAGACGASQPAFSGVVDDLIIFVEVRQIDGPGRILGSAGPCYIRMQGGLPIAGLILLDAADLASMESNGTLDEVVLHEMGHVMGVGTLWGGALTGAGGGDPYFGRPGAVAAFLAAGGASYPGNPVPVENTGGGGTRDAHWRESVLANELMTGYIAGSGNPLSAISVASLGDLGYTVDPAAADGWALPSGVPSQAAGGPPLVRIEEGPRPSIRRVDSSGRVEGR